MKLIAASVFDGCNIYVEPAGVFLVKIVEDRAPQQVFADVFSHVFSYSLKQRMAGSDPFQRRVAFQVFLVEDDGWIFATQLAEAWLKTFADGPEGTGQLTQLVNMAVLADFSGIHSNNRRGLSEEIFDHFGHESALLRFGGFADYSRKIQFAFRKSLQRRIGD